MKEWTKCKIEEVVIGDVVEWKGEVRPIDYAPMMDAHDEVHLATRGKSNIYAPKGTEIEVYR